MIFVDANVFMYAVGRPHPLREEAHRFFDEARQNDVPLCTSAEVLQEIAHVYLSTGRVEPLDSAFALIARSVVDIWPLEAEDVIAARQLHTQYPNLQARDLCHLASCRLRDVREIKTFDRAFAAVSP